MSPPASQALRRLFPNLSLSPYSPQYSSGLKTALAIVFIYLKCVCRLQLNDHPVFHLHIIPIEWRFACFLLMFNESVFSLSLIIMKNADKWNLWFAWNRSFFFVKRWALIVDKLIDMNEKTRRIDAQVEEWPLDQTYWWARAVNIFLLVSREKQIAGCIALD